MGRDIHIIVTKYNKTTRFYDEIKLFRNRKEDEFEYDGETGEKLPWTEYKKIDVDVWRNYEMFDGMKSGDGGYGIFPWVGIDFSSLEPKLAEELKKYHDNTRYGCYDFYEINLADMKNYVYTHPLVTDYDSDEWDNWEPGKEKPTKPNPISGMVEDIENYIYFFEDCYRSEPDSCYKILFYFDC